MRARLKVESGEARPDILELDPNQAASLGRSRDNSIVLRSEHVSRLHARVSFEDDYWQIQDFSLNGISLNNERVQQRAKLEHGQEICIGDIHLRFEICEPPASAPTTRTSRGDRKDLSSSSVGQSTAFLHAADMSVLCGFMAAHVGVDRPADLLRPALQLLLSQSNAYVAGYLSPNASDPLPKMVLPDGAGIDHALSRHLTRRAQRDSRSIWLGAEVGESQLADSIREVTDALCVPVRGGGQVMAMLHIYKKGGYFVDRDLRFADAMAEFVGGCLRGFQARHNLQMEVNRLRAHPPAVDELIGDSAALVQLRRQIAQVASQPVPVLIRGEAGVGAEEVALALHRSGPHQCGAFVSVFAGGIAPAVLESALFGCRATSASKTRDEPGYGLEADQGTLFIDEIGELSSDCQNKLQRLIDDKRIRPVGGASDIRADVRVIAATQFDLEAAVAENRFRSALFERLGRIVLDVPPLRAHLDDVPFLVQYFLDKLAVENRREVTLTDAAMHKLRAYMWPGNHRQLRAELEAAVLRTTKDVIDEGDVLVGCERLLMVRA